jgi:hypothetical protein
VRRLEKYALSQFIQICAIMLTGPWRYIEDYVAGGSALLRFSRHWIVWDTWSLDLYTHEYVGVKAVELSYAITPDTLDPRRYDIEHWYAECGDNFNALCAHNIIRQERERQAIARILTMEPPARWGFEKEHRRQSFS